MKKSEFIKNEMIEIMMDFAKQNPHINSPLVNKAKELKSALETEKDMIEITIQSKVNGDIELFNEIQLKHASVDANYYQRKASRTLLQEPDFQITSQQVMLSWNALGLAGEAGEVADLIKKGIYHQQGIDLEKLRKELGDVMWYIVAICEHTGLTLAEVMQMNIIKLNDRYPKGYNPNDSTTGFDRAKPRL